MFLKKKNLEPYIWSWWQPNKCNTGVWETLEPACKEPHQGDKKVTSYYAGGWQDAVNKGKSLSGFLQLQRIVYQF